MTTASRPTPRLQRFLVTAAILVAIESPAVGREIYDGRWIEARSPNFVVASAIDADATVRLVQELEDFRQVVASFTNVRVLEPRVPTWMFVFPREVGSLGLSGLVAGLFHNDMRANFAIVRVVPGVPLSQVIQHEYAHFLMHNQGSQAYPRWYDEGLAEVLATVNLREGAFDFGNASMGRLYELYQPGAWMSYERLVDDDQVRDMSQKEVLRYYAQSWALVHYLSFGKPGFSVTDALTAYLDDRESGTRSTPAFERAFGEDASTLARVVQRYLKKGARYGRGNLKSPFAADAVQVRQLPRDEVAAAVAGLFLMRGRQAEADARTEADAGASACAAAALADNPRNARALVIQADLHKFAGRYAEAQALYPQAIALQPENDLHHLDFGEYWLDLAEAASDGAQRRELLSKARQEFVLAHKLNDRNPETLAMYGSSFLAAGEDPARGLDTLELAHQLLPSESGIKLLLARVYMAVGRGGEAQPLLRSVIAWDHEGRATAARELLAQIEARQAAPAVAPQ